MTQTSDRRVRVFCALDGRDLEAILALARTLAGQVDVFKLGLELFCAQGPDGVAALGALDAPLFLDLKFHDIPNTVAGAVRSVAPLAPAYLTLHAAGGAAMLRAAVGAAREEAARLDRSPPRLLGVTVLTSLDDADLAAQGVAARAADQVLRLAGLAQAAGCDGVVASPREIAALRRECGPEFEIVVPGIRPAWAASQDQKRVTTPAEAARDGADLLVIGRPITAAQDPAAATARIAAELAGARG